MPNLRITLDLDADPWVDLAQLGERADLERIGALPNGTTGRTPSVALCVRLADGARVVAKTTLALFLGAADAMRERHGDPRQNQATREPPAAREILVRPKYIDGRARELEILDDAAALGDLGIVDGDTLFVVVVPAALLEPKQ